MKKPDILFDDYIVLSQEKRGLVCEFVVRPDFVSGFNASHNYHFHSTYEMHVPVIGNTRILSEDKNLIVKPGSVCIIPPDNTHYVFENQDSFKIAFRFNFSKSNKTDDFSDLFIDSFSEINEATVINDCDIYNKYIRSATENYNKKMPDYMTADLLFLALSDIAHIIKKDNLKGENNYVINTSGETLLCEKIETFLNKNYDNNITVSDLANNLNLSVRQTQRIMIKLFGMSFGSLLNKRKLATAKLLLKSSDKTIEEISVLSGFSDKNYFYRRFTDAFGITPGKYKLKNQ